MKKIIYILSALACLLTSCHDKQEEFEINGHISAAEGKTLHFEANTLNGIKALDSVRLKSDGSFRFQAARPAGPEFYRLRIDRQIINLSVDSTETLHVEAALPDMGTAYTVEGSDNCTTIKEISNRLTRLQSAVQNIINDRKLTLGEQERMVQEEINRYKDDMKRNYILKDPSTPSAYFALFQTLGGQLIFNPVNNPDDIKFVGAVATAWDACYPGTERTENLHNIAIQGMKNTKRPTPVTLEDIDPDKISATGIIEIELPDLHGQTRRLSDIKNKAVLLDFTAYSLPQSQERIMQMRELYNKYAAQGFEIYQISIDPDEHYWKTASEHLPWICVYDSRGEASGYLSSYQVRQIPTFFLINKNGDLVARDEQIENLEAAIQDLCR